VLGSERAVSPTLRMPDESAQLSEIRIVITEALASARGAVEVPDSHLRLPSDSVSQRRRWFHCLLRTLSASLRR
jgi:hypothetical protein